MITIRFIKSRGWIPKIIRWFTWSKWNHVDINVGGNYFGSTAGKGVYMNDYPKREIREFEEILVPTTRDSEMVVEEFLRAQLGKKYDWRGVFSFIFRKNLNKRNRWFCSELVAEALNVEGNNFHFENSFKVSPATLYRVLKASEFTIS